MRKNHLYIKEFEVDISRLTSSQKKVLNKLVQAAKLISPIYAQQVNDDYPGANYYPHDITKEEVEKAAYKNPEILDPFTVVERKNGKLVATPYHQKYKRELMKVADVLDEASKLSDDASFSSYITTCATSLLSGDYRAIDQAWLAEENKNHPIDFLIGPFERYLDKLLFVKRAYQAHVGIKREKETEVAHKIRNTLVATALATPEKDHYLVSPREIEIWAEDTLIMSGFLSQSLFSEEHFPCDLDVIEQYGSRILLYLPTLKLRFERFFYPIFEMIFAESFKASYSKELLEKAASYYILLYGIAQRLHRYPGAESRLKDLHPVFDEANNGTSGVYHCRDLIMKGVIDQKDLEAIIIMHICWMFAEWVYYREEKTRFDYLRGDALTLNFYFLEGALREAEGLSWPNFSKIFFTIENLAGIFVRILREGSYQEAAKFIEKYLSYQSFEVFEKKLSEIHTVKESALGGVTVH